MPLRCEVSRESQLITVLGDGQSSVAEVLSLMDQLAALGADESRWPIFADVRTLEYVASYDEARQIASRLRVLPVYRDRPIAVLVTSLAQLGLGRFVAALAGFGGIIMEVFREESLARAWVESQRNRTGGTDRAPAPPR